MRLAAPRCGKALPALPYRMRIDKLRGYASAAGTASIIKEILHGKASLTALESGKPQTTTWPRLSETWHRTLSATSRGYRLLRAAHEDSPARSSHACKTPK